MAHARDIAHQLAIASRLAARSLRRRLSGAEARRPATDAEFRATLEPWVAPLAARTRRGPRVPLAAGARSRPGTTPASTSAPASRSRCWPTAASTSRGRSTSGWGRPSSSGAASGERGPVFRGTRATHTFTARERRPPLARELFPRRMGGPERPARHAGRASTRRSRAACRCWCCAGRAAPTCTACSAASRGTRGCPGLVLAEAERFDQPVPVARALGLPLVPRPRRDLPPVAQPGRAAARSAATPTATWASCGARPAARSSPGTRLRWSWRVDELPIDLAGGHAAVARLPEHRGRVRRRPGPHLLLERGAAGRGTVYRCPLPTWKDKETHVVVRSGRAGLGRWLDEERDLHADYRADHRRPGARSRARLADRQQPVPAWPRPLRVCEHSADHQRRDPRGPLTTSTAGETTCTD